MECAHLTAPADEVTGKIHHILDQIVDEIDRDFVKLLLATSQQIQNIVDVEKRELLEKLKEQDTDVSNHL